MDDYRLNTRHDDFQRITTPVLAKDFVERRVRELSAEVGESRVVLAYSGGVCSTVCAALLREAIGDRLHSAFVFVDSGDAARAAHVAETYQAQFAQDLEVMDAKEVIEHLLLQTSVPEEISRIIGTYFIEAFRDLATKHNTGFVGTGTIYPNIVETRRNQPNHHSIISEPFGDGIELVEPVKLLYKDEVRVIARMLGLHVNPDNCNLPINSHME